MEDPFDPSPATLAKIGSIIVHVEELLSEDGHEFDKVAMQALLADKDVQDWLAGMAENALLPLRRSA